MRRLSILLVLLCFGAPAFAQTTTSVSGTITDSGGQAWLRGQITFTFKPSPSNPSGQYFNGGAPFNTNTTITQALDNTGSFSGLSVPSNATISPSGSAWTVQTCSAATVASGCFVTSLTISGASQNISSAVIPPAIQVSLSGGNAAYSDAEIINPHQGSFYANLTDGTVHYCSTVPPCTWVALASASSILGTNNTFTGNNTFSGPSTFSGQATTNAFYVTDAPCAAGIGGLTLFCSDSTDNLVKININGSGLTNLPETTQLTSNYTNSTTSFTPLPSFSYDPSTGHNYTISCKMFVEGSAVTAAPKFEIVGTAVLNYLVVSLSAASGVAALGNTTTNAYSTALTLGNLGATAPTFFEQDINIGFQVSTTGAFNLNAAANGAGTLTILAGSTCSFQ
jgi:hypothetical protein